MKNKKIFTVYVFIDLWIHSPNCFLSFFELSKNRFAEMKKNKLLLVPYRIWKEVAKLEFIHFGHTQ